MFFLLSLSRAEEVSLENDYFKQTWTITDDKHLKTKEFVNKRTDTTLTLTPADGSEEFIISLLGKKDIPAALDKSTWKATANSEESTEGAEGPAQNLLDNNVHTMWHSKYSDSGKGGHDDRPHPTDPFNFTVNTQTPVKFKAISYIPRADGNPNGVLKAFKLYAGKTLDEINQKAKAGTPDFEGTFVKNYQNHCYVNMTKEIEAQYIMIVAMGLNNFGSGAEFDLYPDFIPTLFMTIKASDFKLKEHKKDGNKITFSYEPTIFYESTWTINMIYDMEAKKHYLHKYFEIKSSDDSIKIDYIDLIHINLNDEDKKKSWGSPFVENTFKNLGQPLYLNTFFTGCRFPVAHTKFEDDTNIGRIRYYSGKKFADLAHNDQGFYETWKTVFGAARDSRMAVVRQDFFEYITDISTKSPFRKQYNSWYDWMLSITEENIQTSFREIEKGCTQYGIPPLDSYVVDDGWNNYNSKKYGVYYPPWSGTTYNQGGFWEFNDKFPHKFTPSSEFSRKVGSNFGVWLGPRGGYSSPAAFGKMMEDAGMGYYNKNGQDVDVGSHKYIKNMKDLLISFIKDYKVNYYKLDGFTDNPCTDPTHDHMVGGPDNMYFYTDEYEHIIEAYKEMIKTAEDVGLDNFWISSTTWTSLSPFHLQWSNSVWIQISGDAGQIIIGNNTNQADQALTYRDNCYHSFYAEREYQFPAKNLYNHDPIYGQTGTALRDSMDDDYFRTFLSGCVMRGTAFFELYYTYDMLYEGDKWYVSADVLTWAEKNHEILRHSQIFGGNPGNGEVYGFSAWNEWDGAISLRNPGTKVVEFSVVLDRNIGVTEGIEKTYRSTRLHHRTTATEEIKSGVPYKYGDTLKVTLNPGEYRIYEFRKVLDTIPPKIELIKAKADNQVDVRFDEYIDLTNAKFSISGLKILDYKIRGDLRTVTLTVSSMVANTDYVLNVENVADIFGNKFSGKKTFTYFMNNMIGYKQGQFIVQAPIELTKKEVETDSFTLQMNFIAKKTIDNARLMYTADGNIEVKIVDNAVSFKVGNLTLVTDKLTEDFFKITCVRERNTMLKIYIDGELVKSLYDKYQPQNVVVGKVTLGSVIRTISHAEVYNYALGYNEIGKEINIGNEFIARDFQIVDGKVRSSAVRNLRTNSVFVPQQDSEEFIIASHAFSMTKEQPLDRKNWKITANSEETTVAGQEGAAVNLIDGNIKTLWHSRYSTSGQGGHDDRQSKKDPFRIDIDMGKIQEIGAFSYTPRQVGDNGIVKNYEFYGAETKEELDAMVQDGKYLVKGTFEYDGLYPVYINLTALVKVRYVAFRDIIDSEKEYGSGAEFNIYAKFVHPSHYVKSSQFTLDSYNLVSDDDIQTLSFVYKPLNYKNEEITVTENIILNKSKHYIEKELSVKFAQTSSIIIDYIDLDVFVLSHGDREHSWKHTNHADYDSYLNVDFINLGQPIYVNDLFFACRFPLSDNDIVNDNVARLRYYSGKRFSELDMTGDKYVCWKTVLGAAREESIPVIRADFFSYIDDIVIPTKFRKQYNSWYDWMLDINESNILESFKEIEKGCTQFGVPPLDSYVIDDGWNNYNSEKYHVYEPTVSGTTNNTEGFWTFNNKFPQGLTKPSDYARKMSSGFGLWHGPRGGYGVPHQFAQMIQDAGKGYVNSREYDIDVGSHKYIEGLKQLWSNWTALYKINYWKLDGFQFRDCLDESHDHKTGGFRGMYYWVDMWERYIKVFQYIRKTAVDNAVMDFWISITTWVNPSPFHLQWANSVYIQISSDHDFIDIGGNHNYADQMLTYRDSCYYNFTDYLQFQFPLKFLYNHDPIYGKWGTPLQNSMTDEEFRYFLSFCAMRGNAFWEMYFSYTMLDEGEKWYVNADVLHWIESRYDVLQHSQRFGLDSRLGEVYGYSAWTMREAGATGTISLRNPGGETKKYKITLDRTIGVPEDAKEIFPILYFNHKVPSQQFPENKALHYGDSMEFVLPGGSGIIINFEPVADKKAPEVEVAKFIAQDQILVRFNKPVRLHEGCFKVEKKNVVNMTMKADFKTVIITTDKKFCKNNHYKLSIVKLEDLLGNPLNSDITLNYVANNKIIELNATVANKKMTLSSTSFNLDTFSFKFSLNDMKSNYNGVILQDEENKVFVALDDGHVKFTVGDVTARSLEKISAHDNVTLVRERNSLIKIYVNGVISNTSFAKGQSISHNLKTIELLESGLEFESITATNQALGYNETNIDLPDDYVDVPTDNTDDNSNRKLIIIVSVSVVSVCVVIVIALSVFMCMRKKDAGINSIPLISQQ